MIEQGTAPVVFDDGNSLVELHRNYTDSVVASDTILAANERYSVGPQDIDQRLKDIFRLSFFLSNGNPGLQCYYQFSAVRVMREALQDDELFTHQLDALRIRTKDYLPPKNHVELGRTRTLFRIAKIGRIYKDICWNNADTRPVREDSEMNLESWRVFKLDTRFGLHLFSMLRIMAVRDMVYMSEGRPNSVSQAAARRSFFKNYVLDLMPTGNPEMDYTNALMRATLEYQMSPDFRLMRRVERTPTTRLKPLAIMWESLHDGQFWPDDIATSLGLPRAEAEISGNNWELIRS